VSAAGRPCWGWEGGGGRTRGLAEGSEGVDGGDALRKHAVCSELGELGAPDVCAEDALLGDPRGVEVHDFLGSEAAGRGIQGADEDSVGSLQVEDGGALGEELGVADYLEARLGVDGVRLQHLAQHLGGADGHGALLHDHLVRVDRARNFRDYSPRRRGRRLHCPPVVCPQL